ncbi:MAG: zinc-binding dehydrogenase, partial [Dehalococcoidales bacterium]
EDFTSNGEIYDLILDVTVQRWISDYKRALNTNGICLMVGGSMTKVFTNIILGKLSSGKKEVGLGGWKPNRKEDLDFLQELFESGELKPVIDKYYSLKEVPEAFRCLQKGNAKGKLVVTIP